MHVNSKALVRWPEPTSGGCSQTSAHLKLKKRWKQLLWAPTVRQEVLEPRRDLHTRKHNMCSRLHVSVSQAAKGDTPETPGGRYSRHAGANRSPPRLTWSCITQPQQKARGSVLLKNKLHDVVSYIFTFIHTSFMSATDLRGQQVFKPTH